jgi:hypothetical protein
MLPRCEIRSGKLVEIYRKLAGSMWGNGEIRREVGGKYRKIGVNMREIGQIWGKMEQI